VGRRRSALAGAVAALVWAAAEPLDRRLVRDGYSDIALLGKAFTRGPAWPVLGLALHAANGAAFGLVFEETRQRTRIEPVRLGVGLALAEHVALFPLTLVVDRFHPARGEPGVVNLASRRNFALATYRHALFGAVLGRLAR
jgi:hypothetical protein